MNISPITNPIFVKLSMMFLVKLRLLRNWMFSKPKTYIANSLYFIKYSSYSGHIFYIVVNILVNSNTYWIYLTFGIYFSYLHPSFILYYMGYSEYQLYLLYFGASCTKYRVILLTLYTDALRLRLRVCYWYFDKPLIPTRP